MKQKSSSTELNTKKEKVLFLVKEKYKTTQNIKKGGDKQIDLYTLLKKGRFDFLQEPESMFTIDLEKGKTTILSEQLLEQIKKETETLAEKYPKAKEILEQQVKDSQNVFLKRTVNYMLNQESVEKDLESFFEEAKNITFDLSSLSFHTGSRGKIVYLGKREVANNYAKRSEFTENDKIDIEKPNFPVLLEIEADVENLRGDLTDCCHKLDYTSDVPVVFQSLENIGQVKHIGSISNKKIKSVTIFPSFDNNELIQESKNEYI